MSEEEMPILERGTACPFWDYCSFFFPSALKFGEKKIYTAGAVKVAVIHNHTDAYCYIYYVMLYILHTVIKIFLSLLLIMKRSVKPHNK